jgi:hypothetical protein
MEGAMETVDTTAFAFALGVAIGVAGACICGALVWKIGKIFDSATMVKSLAAQNLHLQRMVDNLKDRTLVAEATAAEAHQAGGEAVVSHQEILTDCRDFIEEVQKRRAYGIPDAGPLLGRLTDIVGTQVPLLSFSRNQVEDVVTTNNGRGK